MRAHGGLFSCRPATGSSWALLTKRRLPSIGRRLRRSGGRHVPLPASRRIWDRRRRRRSAHLHGRVRGVRFPLQLRRHRRRQQIAVLERRWFGRGMPEGRVVAMANEVGIQARILEPGLHLLTPFLYRTEKQQMVVVAESEIGLVESIDGAPVPPGRIFGKALQNHNLFQDGEAFLNGGGEKGPQVQDTPPRHLPHQPVPVQGHQAPGSEDSQQQDRRRRRHDGQPIAPGACSPSA